MNNPLHADWLHDLKTPLNQVIGYSEMLLEQAREDKQEAYVPDLEKVCAAGQRMLGMIEFRSVEGPELVTTEPALFIEPSTPTGEGLLLVVDDDAANREVLSRRLQKQGYATKSAEDGLKAMEMLRSQAFDMVLLDIMMPGMDGYDVLARMKADERLRHIPVVMISALSEMESVARCISMGADDYLTKPFNPVLLRARIESSLDKKRARDREVQLFEQVQQNYKRLQELERLRDDLTNMIIHDLRTPLTSVMAAMQTLDVVGDVNPAQREVMTIAVDGADSLLSMINSLLDVEKLEAGAMELDLTLLSLPEVVDAALAQVSPVAEAKGLTLTKEIAVDVPWLRADENKLQRIIVNLLGNAVKFTPAGGTVALQVTLADSAVEFCIQDTGEGIPSDSFERIFEKFGQVNPSEATGGMSTGLGLTFCKLAVEAHGGDIRVSSTPGEGSRFCFTIPIETQADLGRV